MIEAFVLDGTVTLFALAVLAIEAVFLFRAAGTHGRSRLPIVANALSGVFLILALRAALVGSGALAVAVWLALGGIAHGVDTAMRLRR
ncbi:MAG: hypothetical protein H7Y08_06790 [Rhizobiaceae bacterium]|nr:hypothetical protein [Rhizobiaceae bacterium]